MRFCYVLGVPGAGKSTLLREWARMPGISGKQVRTKPFSHTVYYGGSPVEDGRLVARAAQMGGHHTTFPGTDRLSMSVQPKAIEWLQGAPFPMVFAEGDRLATDGFFQAVDETTRGQWDLVYLNTPPELAAERRAFRAQAHGTTQNASWVQGRVTKVNRLAKAWAHRTTLIAGDAPVASQLEVLTSLPVFAWAQNSG
jgi:hypothetical protein